MGTIKNLEKINRIKRSLVEQIISEISKNEYVTRVIIFGSAIRDDCEETSDIDIDIEWKEECYDTDCVLKQFTLPVYRIISKITEGNNDVVYIGFEGALKDEVKKGITIYEY